MPFYIIIANKEQLKYRNRQKKPKKTYNTNCVYTTGFPVNFTKNPLILS